MINLIQSYGEGSSDEEDQSTVEESKTSKEEEPAPAVSVDIKSKLNQINTCPYVDESHVKDFKLKNEFQSTINTDVSTKLNYNAKYDDLYAPALGPSHPLKDSSHLPRKNFLTGQVEPTAINDYHFETQRKTFHVHGIAYDPSDGATLKDKVVRGAASAEIGLSVASSSDNPDVKAYASSDPSSRKKRLKNDDPMDIDNYLGPWAPYENEEMVSKPTEEEQKEIEEFMSKKKRYTVNKEEKDFEEKSTLHIPDPYDYQGRSFLHPPQDLDVNLRADSVPHKCFLPKKVIHTYTGHTKALTAIRWFPKSAHLFLSAGMDAKIKLWEVYRDRRCILTYQGHRQAVRDICFNRRGDRFISAGYDRGLKLWDTETGQCIKRFQNRKVPFCVKFNNDEDKNHLFLSGMADKKILCWDTRTGQIVQEYDRHLGAINTITFVDNNRRFVSSSDDKSLRVWEWDIPVDIKYIADPGLHSMPAISASPNGKWLACQSMDNKIQGFACLNSFKLNSKKIFTGHMVAGYACAPDFSPDMSYLVSGDADGKVFIWDWKTTKLLTKFQAHENVCINVLWHPHETSKVLSAGWDNKIHLWD